jgi:hypothetical protein
MLATALSPAALLLLMIAVKIINDLGNELMVVRRLNE